MAKKKKKKYRPQGIRHKYGTSSTEYSISSDSTLGSEEPLEQPPTGSYIAGDSTSAPEIGKDSEASEQYTKSQWEFADKYISSKQYIPFAVVVAIIGWIIIQDNGAGKLTDWISMFWTIQKCGVILGLFVIILFFQLIHQKIFK